MNFGLKKRREVGQWPVTPVAFIRTGWRERGDWDLGTDTHRMCAGVQILLTSHCRLSDIQCTFKGQQSGQLCRYDSCYWCPCWHVVRDCGATRAPRTGLAGLAEKIPGIVSLTDTAPGSVHWAVLCGYQLSEENTLRSHLQLHYNAREFLCWTID